MRETVIFWRVTLPQAMRTIIPPTTNQFISMLKDPSLISVMGVWEVMFLAQSYGHSSYRYIEMLTTAAVICWVMSIGLELIQAWMERHYGKAHLSRSEGRNCSFRTYAALGARLLAMTISKTPSPASRAPDFQSNASRATQPLAQLGSRRIRTTPIIIPNGRNTAFSDFSV